MTYGIHLELICLNCLMFKFKKSYFVTLIITVFALTRMLKAFVYPEKTQMFLHFISIKSEIILKGRAENIFSSAWFSFCSFFVQCLSSFGR